WNFLNPCSSALIPYRPGTTPLTMKVPSSPDTVSLNIPVSWFLTVTVTPGNSPPCGSRTRPRTSVVPCCADAVATPISSTSIHALACLLIFPPVFFQCAGFRYGRRKRITRRSATEWRNPAVWIATGKTCAETAIFRLNLHHWASVTQPIARQVPCEFVPPPGPGSQGLSLDCGLQPRREYT